MKGHDQSSIRDWNIRFLSLDGSATSLTFPNTPKSERQAMFSPDGRWLAYTSDESGRSEFLMAKPQLSGVPSDVVVVVNWFAELNRSMSKK